VVAPKTVRAQRNCAPETFGFQIPGKKCFLSRSWGLWYPGKGNRGSRGNGIGPSSWDQVLAPRFLGWKRARFVGSPVRAPPGKFPVGFKPRNGSARELTNRSWFNPGPSCPKELTGEKPIPVPVPAGPQTTQELTIPPGTAKGLWFPFPNPGPNRHAIQGQPAFGNR